VRGAGKNLRLTMPTRCSSKINAIANNRAPLASWWIKTPIPFTKPNANSR